MQLSTFSTCVLVLLSLITWKLCYGAHEAHKVGPIFNLCADQFKGTWERCCGHQCGVNALKRSLGKRCNNPCLPPIQTELISLVLWLFQCWARLAKSLDPILSGDIIE